MAIFSEMPARTILRTAARRKSWNRRPGTVARLQAERQLDRIAAEGWFERGCDLGFMPACRNMNRIITGSATAETASPTLQDYPIILRGSKTPISNLTPSALYALACSQGWPDTCDQIRR